MKENCTVLVSSCDGYEELWIPFFTLFQKYWPDCQYPILLNTESKSFSFPGLNIQELHSNEQGWSGRLKEALQQVKTTYVILLLDDFFFTAPVDQERILQCIRWMEESPDVVNFSFAPTLWPDIDDGKYPGFELRPYKSECRFNFQAGLWRTKTLYSLLRAHESPWQAEDFGTSRSNRHRNWKFYAAAKEMPCVFSYEFGGGLHQGKWTTFTKELFEKNGLTVNYDKRGFDPRPTSDWEKPLPPARQQASLYYRIKRFVKNWKSYI